MIRLFPNLPALAAVVCAWLLTSSQAAAWSATGHRIAANIAYDRLDETTRANIVRILRKHEDFDRRFKQRLPTEIQPGSPEEDRWIFLQASIWPDLIRSTPKYHRDTWHYINIPYYLTPLDKAALENAIKPNISFGLPTPLTDEAKRKLNCVQAVKLAIRDLSDAATSDEDKAIAYCWLLHLGGDMHQPMHSTSLITRGRFQTSEGDRGGNGIKTEQSRNLHAFWDGLLGGDATLNGIRGRSVEILSAEENKKAAEAAAKDLLPDNWTLESHKLAREFAYDQKSILAAVALREAGAAELGNIDLPLDYRKDAGHHAQRRVAEAGYRLAEVMKNGQKAVSP